MAHLTRRQKEILDYLGEYRERTGIFPTLREIGDHFSISSYGTIHKHLRLLEEKGFIRRERHLSRAIELDGEPVSGGGSNGDLPLLGWIAAGQPLETVSEPESIAVPTHLRGPRGGADSHYVLKVTGTSMVEEGIFDGDLVVVQRRPARSGEMVVALVDREATLKRFFPEGANVRLQPSNREMEPIVVPAESVELQGVVVGLMRHYA